MGYMVDEDNITINKGQLDRILDELIEIPEDLSNIRNLIASDFESLITKLKDKISELNLKSKIDSNNLELQKLNKELEPFLKKIAGQNELKKLIEKLEKEKQKKTKSEQLEKQLKNILEDYGNSKKRICELLNNRFGAYKQIVDKVNESKTEIGLVKK